LFVVLVGVAVYAGEPGGPNAARGAGAFQVPAESRRHDVERDDIEACREWAPAQECERDRLVIAIGLGSTTYNPCN